METAKINMWIPLYVIPAETGIQKI